MTGAAASGGMGSSGGGALNIDIAFSPATQVSGFVDNAAPTNVTTGSVLATPSGGIAPYTYAWARKDVSAYTWTIGTASAATTNFTCQAVEVGVSTQAIFELTVTDSLGNKGKKSITAKAKNKTILDDGGGTQ